MDNLSEFSAKVPFKVYGRALEWGYPMGVGYRYLTLSQSLLLLRTSDAQVSNSVVHHAAGTGVQIEGAAQGIACNNATPYLEQVTLNGGGISCTAGSTPWRCTSRSCKPYSAISSSSRS
jgi:hypothetical protein